MSEKTNGGKLKQVIEAKGTSYKALAEQTGMSIGALRNIAAGQRNISSFLAGRLLEIYPDINADWLLDKDGRVPYMSEDAAKADLLQAYSGYENLYAIKYQSFLTLLYGQGNEISHNGNTTTISWDNSSRTLKCDDDEFMALFREIDYIIEAKFAWFKSERSARVKYTEKT